MLDRKPRTGLTVGPFEYADRWGRQPVELVETLQREQLFGSPYAGALAGDLAPYDLNASGAVAEIKATLRALAEAESDPFKKGPEEVVTEQTWRGITVDDVWNDPAGEEFLLAVSRYRGFGVQIGEPYAQSGLPGGVPQPAVNGLELIAGAARQRLGEAHAMQKYEAWRKQGCAIEAACFAPPSMVSKPPSDTPVTLTVETGLRLVAPPEAPKEILALVQAAEVMQAELWRSALEAETEAERAAIAGMMKQARVERDRYAQSAIDATPGRGGTTVLDEDFRRCVDTGGQWDPDRRVCTPAAGGDPVAQASTTGPGMGALVFGAIGLGALYWAFRGEEKKKTYRSNGRRRRRR